MLIDARTVEHDAVFDADICIVGGGPAGLAIAHALSGSGLEVVLLEGGGQEWDQDDQQLFWGESVGRPYLPLDGARLRYLGGNSGIWGGWCTPFRDGAFEPRPWLGDNGWPITAVEMAPYVERAAHLIGLPDEGWDPDYWADRLGVERLPLRPDSLEAYVVLIEKTRFGETLGPAVIADPSTRLFLHANLVKIETDADARRVTGVLARTRTDQRSLTVRARHYVLALGAIENARQLLLANEVVPAGLGNRHDKVGRYFADHVSFHGGILQLADPSMDLGLADRHRRDDVEMLSQLILPRAIAEREELLRARMRLRPVHDPAWDGRGMRSVRALRVAARSLDWPDEGLGQHLVNIARDMTDILGLGYRSWQAGGLPIDHVALLTSVGPALNPDSRVMLGDTFDPLGQRHVALDWRLSPVDKRSARYMLETFAAEAGAAGLGRVQITMNEDDEDFDDVYVQPACHQMCTTRMDTDPTKGVVDTHCRVHDVDNLYCAGSSVFSSTGDGSPTMMLLALALRLAEHLKGQPT